jgi:GDPmannose 4,6-dehydratase
MTSCALITGICGQDGAYLASRLLGEGCGVIGTMRPNAAPTSSWRLKELGIVEHPRLQLRELDITDENATRALIADAKPSSLFHFAAQSSVAESFRDPLGSARINGLAALSVLEAVRRTSPTTRFVLASSAEIFGDTSSSPLDESTPFRPNSPYGAAKQFAHSSTVAYRASFGLHASCAILFNHESPLRDANFVSRKIAAAAARLAQTDGDALTLGNLDAQRDYGYAPEYVAAMAAMAEQDPPDDYVIATGIATSVREFATFAFEAAGFDLEWRGASAKESARDRKSGRVLVRVDPALLRPVDARALIGNAAKARATLKFAPQTSVAELARQMVEAEIQRRRSQ